jgi:hypothetical protein
MWFASMRRLFYAAMHPFSLFDTHLFHPPSPDQEQLASDRNLESRKSYSGLEIKNQKSELKIVVSDGNAM